MCIVEGVSIIRIKNEREVKYEFKPAYIENDSNTVSLVFRDSIFHNGGDKEHYERTMLVDGKEFCVCSFYDSEPKSTPIEKLLKLIDIDNKKS